MLKFIIPGEPIAKMRHRMTRKGFSYDPQSREKETVKYQLLQIIAKEYKSVLFPLQGPIDCELSFYFKLPDSYMKTKQNLVKWKLLKHIIKPDNDNLAKFYLDCMSKIIYEDDRQICNLSIKKEYAEENRTEIVLMSSRKTLPEKAEEMLSLFSPEEFGELAGDMQIVADCLDMEFLTSKHEIKEQLQMEAAYHLSIFADKYGSKLSQISKKYAGIHKIIDEFQNKINPNRDTGENTEIYINGFRC